MFTLLKYELRYLIYSTKLIIPVLLGLYLYSFFSQINIINLASYAVSILLIIQLVGIGVKEQRIRMVIPLSLSNKSIAITRILLVLSIFAIIFGVANLIHLFFLEKTEMFKNSIAELNMFGSEVLLMIFTFILINDYFSLFSTKFGAKIFNLISVFVITVLMVVSAGTISSAYDDSKAIGLLLIALSYFLSIILAVISVFSFRYKESHSA